MGRETVVATELLRPGTSSVAASRTLWYACRGNLPPASAVLARTPTGDELLVTFGDAARQQVSFTNALAAVRHAEHLLCRLEGAGYRRCRAPRKGGDRR